MALQRRRRNIALREEVRRRCAARRARAAEAAARALFEAWAPSVNLRLLTQPAQRTLGALSAAATRIERCGRGLLARRAVGAEHGWTLAACDAMEEFQLPVESALALAGLAMP